MYNESKSLYNIAAIRNSLTHLPKDKNINSNITTLRYFLACTVVFTHLTIWYTFAKGFMEYSYLCVLIIHIFNVLFRAAGETHLAVLFFIVLSGYCIHRNGLRDNYFYLSAYFKRRFLRIYPLFFIWCIGGALLFWFTNTELTHALTDTKNITLSDLFIKITALHSFVPQMFERAYQGNVPLITVGVELWLYLLYPIMLVFYNKIGSLKFLCFLIIYHLFWCAILSLEPQYREWWHNGSLFGFLVYWYIGVYFVDKQVVQQVSKYTKTIIMGLVILSIIVIVFTHNIFLVELRKILLSMLAGICIANLDVFKRSGMSEIPDKSENFKSLDNDKNSLAAYKIYVASTKIQSFLNELQESSYSLYASHGPVLVLLINFDINFFVAFLVVIVFGYINYKLIEQPLTRFSKRDDSAKLETDLVYQGSVSNQ